jgi:hypothetical protein
MTFSQHVLSVLLGPQTCRVLLAVCHNPCIYEFLFLWVLAIEPQGLVHSVYR